MRALSRSCGNGIPASSQARGSAAGHRSAVFGCHSPTSRARCARRSRSRPTDRHSRICDENVDADRPVDANASPALGSPDVTAETRRCVRPICRAGGVTSLTMKPVVFARKHRPNNQNLRDLRKDNDCAKYRECRRRTDPVRFSRFRSGETA